MGHSPGSLRVRGNELHYHPDKPPALHDRTTWKFEDGDFHVVRIESPVRVHFSPNGEQCEAQGPMQPLLFVDGLIYVEGQEQPIAVLVESDQWSDPSTGEAWPEIVITSA